ncbi:hypothetical protein M8J75_007372 [Diaphorina citri]|nr:hypothetical protein M8J75_007372 [Diaphorina citri]
MITLSELLKFEIVEDEVDNWFLMTSWVPITSIVAGYLVFVLYVGPKWMANRKPFDIKYILLVYNLAQTLINLYYSISTVSTPGTGLIRHCVFRSQKEMVSHYFPPCLSSSGYGEQTLFLGAINCFVHVAMYSYYFLSAFGPRVQKYLWWKNYITMLQIIQFILVLLQHVGLIVLDCKVDLKISYFIVGNAILFILLFALVNTDSYCFASWICGINTGVSPVLQNADRKVANPLCPVLFLSTATVEYQQFSSSQGFGNPQHQRFRDGEKKQFHFIY